jgi:hypothetical protein
LLPLPELHVAFIPEEKGVDSLARQVKMTGRAYPLFEIAQMVLQKPERHSVTLSVKKKHDDQPAQPLLLCAVDDTLWLSEEEAVRHVLDKHFDLFYQPERTQIEPPKGTYTFVAQCGLSGVILGPPNYHDYQNRLRKLHAEKFAKMPFDAFKARVKIVRDEAVVKKWLEEQSWKTEFVCLNLPEPWKLPSREEVEKHFRAVHLPNIIKVVDSFRVSGAAARQLRSSGLARLLRHAWEEQRRFPLQVATVLSQQFAARGLQFFKVNKTVTHVAVARPHYLDLDAVPVSEGVRRIVNFISARPKCTRRQLVDALAPGPALATADGLVSVGPAAEVTEPTLDQTAVSADLHWLIHQGHVIEFANGVLETAKRPAPKPLKPAPAAASPAETAKAEPPAEQAGASATEAALPQSMRESSPSVEEAANGSHESVTPAPTALADAVEQEPAPAAETELRARSEAEKASETVPFAPQ